MSNSIREFIAGTGIVEVHEHHIAASNIWLDLTWSPLLSPSHFKLALNRAIEILPDESRMMLGGDNWHVEETYGALTLARQLIGEVLEEKLGAGYFRRTDEEQLGVKILRENAHRLFRLG